MTQFSRSENDLEGNFQRWYPAVFRYFRLRGSDEATANDLASTVFERAIGQLHPYDPGRGAYSTWLFTIARNVGANHWKAQAARPVDGLENWENMPGQEQLPEEALIALENRDEVLAALSRLEERERELLALKFASRMTNRQIASLTSLSESNVGVILYRALHHLRILIQQKTGEVSRE